MPSNLHPLSRTATLSVALLFAWVLGIAPTLRAQQDSRVQSVAPPAAPQALTSSVAGGTCTDGTFDLTWLAPGSRRESTAFELEEVHQPEVDAQDTVGDSAGDTAWLSAGPHLSTSLSGRDDGTYRYRVRAVVTLDGTPVTSPWSDPVTVVVKHHSLALAFTLLSLGAAVFLATAALVWSGHRAAEPAAGGAAPGGGR